MGQSRQCRRVTSGHAVTPVSGSQVLIYSVDVNESSVVKCVTHVSVINCVDLSWPQRERWWAGMKDHSLAHLLRNNKGLQEIHMFRDKN